MRKRLLYQIGSLILLLGLGSCGPVPSATLFAGIPYKSPAQLAQSKDGPALMARFTSISDLDVDERGNVYVVDTNYQPASTKDLKADKDKIVLLKDTLIRKISPDGQVTTFAGLNVNADSQPVYPVPLINGTEIEILGNHLYFTNLGCLMSTDLTEEGSTPKFDVVSGSCITPENAKRVVEEENFVPDTKEVYGFLIGNNLNKFYFNIYDGIYEKNKPRKSTGHLLDLKNGVNTISEIPPVFSSANYHSIDSKGFLYRNMDGLPGPGSPGPSGFERYDVVGINAGISQAPPIRGGEQLKSPFLLTIDRKDNLYVMDEGLIKRLSPTGKLETLAQGLNAHASQSGVKLMRVNPDATMLYLTDGTGLYKLPLSPLSN